jgi:hypothetical protein
MRYGLDQRNEALGYRGTIMFVRFRNPRTGEMKQIKVGWSWTLFFFAAWFGIPAFLRRLYGWGIACVLLQLIMLFASAAGEDGALTVLVFGMAQFAVTIYLATKGNELTAKNYLDHGWTMMEPNGLAERVVCMKWGITSV